MHYSNHWLARRRCPFCKEVAPGTLCETCFAEMKAWVNNDDVCHHPAALRRMEKMVHMIECARDRIKSDAAKLHMAKVASEFPAALVTIKEQEKLKSAAIRAALDEQYPGD